MQPIKIFTTGGSIDKAYDLRTSQFTECEPTVTEALALANVRADFTIEEVIRKDSLYITDEDRAQLVEKIAADSSERIIVTHGTDTMALSARQAADRTPNKTVVFTGSMMPAAFKDTDAHFNLGAAFVAVQLLPHGCYIVMNGLVFDPFRIKKNIALKCFEHGE